MNNGSSRQNRHRNVGPRCAVKGCNNQQAAGANRRGKRIPLCLPHMSDAADIDHHARITARRKSLTALAENAGKQPEEMFWAPDVFPSQRLQVAAQVIQDRHDLAHYRRLVAEGKVKTPQEKMPRKPVAQQGSVYYLRVGSYIKIGWSSTIETRMRAYPPDSVLLAAEPGTRKDEQRRHRMFAAHRTHGREWYAMTPSVMHHIEQVAAEHGTPDPVTFAARPVEIPQPRPVEVVTPRGWTGKRVS